MEAELGHYRQRRVAEMHDVQDDVWTERAGRFISVAQVDNLTKHYRRELGVSQWEKANRLVLHKGRMVPAYTVPGTPEARLAESNKAGCEGYISAALQIR